MIDGYGKRVPEGQGSNGQDSVPTGSVFVLCGFTVAVCVSGVLGIYSHSYSKVKIT